MRIDEIMTKDVITVGPGSAIHAAARLMVDHGVSGLPVVDGEGKVVGMVSEGATTRSAPAPPWPRS